MNTHIPWTGPSLKIRGLGNGGKPWLELQWNLGEEETLREFVNWV